MSFHDKNFWLQSDSACLTDGKMDQETSSKGKHKRTHPWGIPVREFSSYKKQAVESIDSRPIPAENVDYSLWKNPSGCQSVSCSNDYLFVPKSIGTCASSGKSLSGNLDMERKGFVAQFENSPRIDLQMTHDMEQSICGIGKADNVNQVKGSGNCFSLSMVQQLSAGENNILTRCNAYQSCDDSIALQPTYQKGNINAFLPFSKPEGNIRSMGQTLTKGDTASMLMGHHYSRENNSTFPAALPYNKWNCSLIAIDQEYGKEIGSLMPAGPGNGKEHGNFIMNGETYDKVAEMSIGTAFDQRGDVITTVGRTQNKNDITAVSKGISYDKQNLNILSMGQNYDDSETTVISFGPDACELPVRLISSSDSSTRQSSEKPSEALPQNDMMEQNVDQMTNVSSTSNTADGAVKIKEQKKKGPTNNFPSNVKSMLSTGIFDGVPVKYVSWSRERSLPGVIKGTGYLCSCGDCEYSKVLNAYELERHAGGKTKHPNNHIIFENGKSVYAAVQELKITPQEMLFEAIENVTGSPINQKNFLIWKVSYQAASRELERIYGKDEAVKRSC